MPVNTPLSSLSDAALITHLETALSRHRDTGIALVLHLGEVEQRKLFAAAGYDTMFAYCTRRLGMCEATASRRLNVARTLRRFPLALRLLKAEKIHQSGVALLAKVLTEGNHAVVLGAACGQSRREIERIRADLAPRPDGRDSIRRRPVRSSTQDAAGAQGQAQAGPLPPVKVAGSGPLLGSRDPDPEPLGAERYSVRFTASAELKAKIEQAQALMGHRLSDGDLSALFEAALDVLVDKVEGERFAARPKSRRTPKKKQGADGVSRHIPNPIKRQVYVRDEGRCAFTSADGHRCGERKRVEFHHRVAWAKGGQHTVNNVQLLCRTHNRWEADADFGAGFMERKIARRRE